MLTKDMLNDARGKKQTISPSNVAIESTREQEKASTKKDEHRKQKRKPSNSPPREQNFAESNGPTTLVQQISEIKPQENKEDVGSVRTSSLDENKERNIEKVSSLNPPHPKEVNETPQQQQTTKYYQPNNHFSFNHRQNSFNKQPHPELTEKAKGKLTKTQVDKLLELLNEEYEIVSKDGSLKIISSAAEILTRITSWLRCEKIPFMSTGIRLVGSAASYVISDTELRELNDLDFSFYIMTEQRFNDILTIQEQALAEIVFEQTDSSYTLKEVYDLFFLDSLKVDSEKECWSLVNFGKKGHRTIDIKFIAKAKRSYVFSSDSFEIVLNPFLVTRRYDTPQKKGGNLEDEIQVESMFGDYIEALSHLKQGILCAKDPEEVRRGIFRYCHELAKGKYPKSEKDREELDRIFSDSLYSEKELNFQDVLIKFVHKHSLNATGCLNELKKVISRTCSNQEEKSKYIEQITTIQNMYKLL